MNRPVSMGAVPMTNLSECASAVRPVALWPVLLVVAIVAFIVWASDAKLNPDQHMLSPYLEAGMAP